MMCCQLLIYSITNQNIIDILDIGKLTCEELSNTPMCDKHKLEKLGGAFLALVPKIEDRVRRHAHLMSSSDASHPIEYALRTEAKLLQAAVEISESLDVSSS